MNRRLVSSDYRLKAPIRSGGNSEKQDWLVGETVSKETDIADREEFADRKELLTKAETSLTKREQHIPTEAQASHLPRSGAIIRHLS